MSSKPPVDTVKHCTSHVACNHTTPLVFEHMFRPFYPVRYVYTQRLEQDQTLPEPPPLRELACTELEKTNDFIARVLRPGWLYVREENGTEDFLIFEYSRKDNNGVIEECFDRYVFTDGKTAKSGLKPASQYESTGIGSFPFVNRNVTEISIRYSEDEWSSETIDQVHQDEQARSQSMKRITLTGQDRTTIDLTHENLQAMVEEYRTDDERVKPSADQLYADPHEVVGRSRSMAEKLRDVKRAMVVALDDPEGWEEPPVEYYAVYPMRLFVELDGEEELAKEYDPDVVSGENKEELAEKLKTLKWQTTSLSDGYLYVFVDGYLYQEFKITLDGQNKALFQAVDLVEEQGKDTRSRIKGLKRPLITVPAEANEIQLGFSRDQWSWLRINTLGGIAPSSPYPNAAIATDETVLAENDDRLTDASEYAPQHREKRLQPINKQTADYLSWHPLEAPCSETDACASAVKSQTLRPLIAQTRRIRLDEHIIDVAIPVLHDHLGIISTLLNRYSGLVTWMTQLLEQLSDRDNKNKEAYPFAEHFDSACLVYHQIMDKGSDDAGDYYPSLLERGADEQDVQQQHVVREQEDLRKMVHIDNLKKALGVAYRNDLRALMIDVYDQLIAFITSNLQGSPYTSLTDDTQTLWFYELQDLLACSFEQDLQGKKSNVPVAEEFFEFLGRLFQSLSCHPKGLDINIEGSHKDIEQFKEDYLEFEASQWLRQTVNKDSDIWKTVLNGYIDGVKSDVADAESTVFVTTTGFHLLRRGVQAISALISGSLPVFRGDYEGGLAAMEALAKRYTGVRFEREPMAEALDIQFVDDIDEASVSRVIKANSMTITHFIQRHRPLLLDKLGGPTAADIQAQRDQDKAVLKHNLDEERTALEDQSDWARKDNETQAKHSYDEKMEALKDEQKGLENNVQVQQGAVDDIEHTYARQKEVWESEINGQRETVDGHNSTRRAAQKRYDDAKRARDQYHQQSVSANASLNRAQQQQTQLQRLLESASQAGQDTSDISQQLSSLNEQVSGLQQQLETAKTHAKNGSELTKALKTPLDEATQAHQIAEAELENQTHKYSVARQEYEHTQQAAKNELKKQQKALNEFNETTYAERSNEAKAHHDIRMEDFEKRQQALLNDHDEMATEQIKAHNVETARQVRERKDAVAAHKAENERLRKQVGKDRDVFDLSDPEDAKAWKNYSAQLLKQRFVVVPDDQLQALTIEKIKLREQVRMKDGKPAAEVNRALYDNLTEKQKLILDSTFVSQSLYDEFEQKMRSQPLLLLDAEVTDAIDRRFLEEEARSLGRTGHMDWPLNSVLVAFEFLNLWGAAEKLSDDTSAYHYVNYLSTVLDVAAAVEALVKTGMEPPVPAQRMSVRLKHAWRFSRLTHMANVLTVVLFAYDTRVALNKNDDVWISYATITTGMVLLAMKSVSLLPAGTLIAGALGPVGWALVVLGAFLWFAVFRENSNIREHVLTLGPFGAYQKIGKRLITVDHHQQYGTLLIKWDDLYRGAMRAIVDARTFRLLEVQQMLARDEQNAIIPGYSTVTEPLSDEGYHIRLYKGSVPLGPIGEAIGGGQLNDAWDLEQHLYAKFQREHAQRFTSWDSFTDEDLGYKLEPSDWEGERAGLAYYESLISALYPLRLEMKVVKDSGLDGNKLHVTYEVPFLHQITSELHLKLKVRHESLQKDFKIDLIEQPKPLYVKKYVNGVTTTLVVDFDDAFFTDSPSLKAAFTTGEIIDIVVTMFASHVLKGSTVYQPPLLNEGGGQNRVTDVRDENIARAKKTYQIYRLAGKYQSSHGIWHETGI